MPYNQYGQWVEDSGYSPLPGAGMPSVTSGGATLGPGGWSDAGPYRTVNDPRESYQPLYDHTHMDDASALGGMLGAGYGQNTPQRSRAIQLLQGLQQQRQQPVQGLAQPGIYQNDPTNPFSPRGAPGIDNVFTGHASEKMPESQSVLSRVPEVQRMLYGGGQSIGNLVTGPDGVARIAQATARAPLSEDEQHAKFWDYVQKEYAKGTLNAEQASQIHARVFGPDPISYAANRMKIADDARKTADDTQNQRIKLATESDRQRKALMDEQAALARSGGGLPEDMLSTFGQNPSPGDHVNEYYNPGVSMGLDDMGNPKIEKAGWRGIDPGTIERIRAIRGELGMDTRPAFDPAAAQARIARGRELEAKATHPAPPSAPARQPLSSWIQNPDNAAQVTEAPWTNLMSPMAVGPVNGSLQLLQYFLNGGGAQRLQDAGSGAVDSIQSALAAARRFVGAQ